jgi:hypothetical protein
MTFTVNFELLLKKLQVNERRFGCVISLAINVLKVFYDQK